MEAFSFLIFEGLTYLRRKNMYSNFPKEGHCLINEVELKEAL